MLVDRQLPLETVKDESRVWEQLIAPGLNLPKNVLSICHHGFTEMLNNVIDHSDGKSVTLHCAQDDQKTVFEITDDGVGVFENLKKHFTLDSNVHALMELVKGKLTVAPEAHSGEGIFFSSKMFDRFMIESGDLSVVFENDFCTVHSTTNRQGTRFVMEISNNSNKTTQEVFARFTDPDELTFCKTKFFISLAAFEGELTSRSQAKRVVSRFENFEEVELDFAEVDHIGQAFADELVRVWPLAHSNTRMKIVHANEPVVKMLKHVIGRHDLPQPIHAIEVDLTETQEQERRIKDLHKLRDTAGAPYTFWKNADSAITQADGDIRKVAWDRVEEATISEWIGKHGQPPKVIFDTLCAYSPGTVSQKKCAAIFSLIEKLAPNLKKQYEQSNTESPANGIAIK